MKINKDRLFYLLETIAGCLGCSNCPAEEACAIYKNLEPELHCYLSLFRWLSHVETIEVTEQEKQNG